MSYGPIHATAVVGTGVIGRSWIRVFARAGLVTRVFDPDPDQAQRALGWARKSARDDVRLGFATEDEVEAELGCIRPCTSLEEALTGVQYVQESGPETLGVKQAIYRDLDAAAPQDAILGSSTSAHDMTVIAEGLPGAHRCIVAHPTNPPHVVPAVEVLPGEKTDPEVTAVTLAFLRRLGQIPVEMLRYAPGFVLNRLQSAVVREAISLVASGVATPQAVDTAMRDGLGLRWALMGPFGTGHTNADGGVGSYYRMYGDAYRAMWADLDTDPEFGDEVIDEITRGTVETYGEGAVEALCDWRNRQVRRIRRLRVEDPPPAPGP